MIYCKIWVITYSLKYLKILWIELLSYISTLFSPCYRLGRNGKLLKCLRILITVVYFKDRNWICKIVYCISSLVVCKIAFYSEFPGIPDSGGRKTRRRTQAIAKRYAFHANAKSSTMFLKQGQARSCNIRGIIYQSWSSFDLLCCLFEEDIHISIHPLPSNNLILIHSGCLAGVTYIFA